jgi:hypothetical protein
MAKLSLEEERDAVDYVTNGMYSAGFLADITACIFSPIAESVTVAQFYRQWLKNSGARGLKAPFSPGAVLGHLYVGILFAKENWFDLVPNVALDESDQEWGLHDAKPVAPECDGMTLRYVVRRIRNSLGHGTAVLHAPEMANKKANPTETILADVTLTLKDTNIRRPSDTFETTVTLGQLFKFVKRFQSAIHTDVRSRMKEAGVDIPPQR